jgi:hypothetical protein
MSERARRIRAVSEPTYDVEALIRDARSEIRAEIDTAVRAARRQFRSELAEKTEELREETSQLREEVANALINGSSLA